MLDNITVNAHSSIRIGGGTVVYVDPFRLTEEAHDADLILFTHPHYDHFSPGDIAGAAKEGTVLIVPESMKVKAEKETDCKYTVITAFAQANMQFFIHVLTLVVKKAFFIFFWLPETSYCHKSIPSSVLHPRESICGRTFP